MRQPSFLRGFTLIELSIVLVIIALLVAGVLVGQALIKLSEMRSITNQVEQYKTAVYTFKNKYNALPGDMTNAENIWGSDASCPNTPVDTAPKAATCNGDGNGQVGVHASSNLRETYRFWQQLGNAELIEGRFTGTTASSYGTEVLGRNIPRSKVMNDAGFDVLAVADDLIPGALSFLYFPGTYGHSFFFGKQASGEMTIAPAITTTDAASIDGKFDDGKPGTGKIVSYKQGNGYTATNCATTNDPTTAIYNPAFTGIECNLIFRQVF